MTPTAIERADVFCDEAKAGVLERTPRGSRFIYEPAFLVRCRERSWGLGFRVPVAEVATTEGVNLHTFFAGLLPEGLRLQALEGAVKTSTDDLFSLLMAVGPDPVGDVRVVPPGASSAAPPMLDLRDVTQVSFDEVLKQSLAYRDGGERRSIPGVQPKVSAAMVTLPVRLRHQGPREAILKLEPQALPLLVANEHFFMTMAAACGLDVPQVQRVQDRDGAPGLLVARFDRRTGDGPQRLHCEDACQFLDRYPADKYRLTFKQVALGVRQFATAPRVELVKLLRLLAFSYLIANGDLHARNVSLLVDAEGLVRLAPAYDLLSTLPYGDRKLALKVQGRDANLKRTHLLDLSRQIEVPTQVTTRMLDALCDVVPQYADRLCEIGLPEKKTAQLQKEMRKRREDLGT